MTGAQVLPPAQAEATGERTPMDDITTVGETDEHDRHDESDESDQTDLLEEELLVEEVSIDGMCGVY